MGAGDCRTLVLQWAFPKRGDVTRVKSKAARVLVVEDDQRTADTIKLYLEHAGFDACMAGDGLGALALYREKPPDLVILDRMLPRADGLEVCRRLRAEGDVPIIMLTARTTEADKLEGLRLGADDYVTKPFSPRELVARVEAVLRRTGPRDRTETLRFDILEVTPALAEVRLEDRPVSLTSTEYKLLEVLCRAPGKVFSRAELVERVLGWDYEGSERTIDVHIVNLRRKIEKNPAKPERIATVHGMGYRFVGERHDD